MTVLSSWDPADSDMGQNPTEVSEDNAPQSTGTLPFAANKLQIPDAALESRIYIDKEDILHVRVFPEEPLGTDHAFVNDHWTSETDWNGTALHTHTAIEDEGPDLDVTIMAKALYESLITTLRYEAVIQAADKAYDTDKHNMNLADNRFQDIYTLNNVAWDRLGYPEKRECVNKWITNICTRISTGYVVQWVKIKDAHFGVIIPDEEIAFTTAQAWPRDLLKELEVSDAAPRIFLRISSGANRLIMYHLFNSHVVHGCISHENEYIPTSNPLYMDTYKEHVVVCASGQMWILGASGELVHEEKLPINVLSKGLLRIPPAYLISKGWIYVFGESKITNKRAVVMRCKMSKMIRSE